MAAVSPRSGALSATQSLAPVDSTGAAGTEKAGPGFDKAREVGRELNDWFSRELADPSLDSRQRSNNVRHEILGALLTGQDCVQSGYHDASRDLAPMLLRHGVTFEVPEDTPQSPPVVSRILSPESIQAGRDVSYVMDVWVDEAADAPQMLERSGARCRIVNAFLAGMTDIRTGFEGVVPDLQRFGISVTGPTSGAVSPAASQADPAAGIRDAISNLRADHSTEGSRLKFRHECAAIYDRIKQLGGDDTNGLMGMMRAMIRNQTTQHNPVSGSQWFLKEVSALQVIKGSEEEFVQGVHICIATAGRMIAASSAPLAEKIDSYKTLLTQAMSVAESMHDPGAQANMRAAVTNTITNIKDDVESMFARSSEEALEKHEYLQTLKAELRKIEEFVGPDG